VGLPEPATPEGREALRSLIAAPARALICLDYDGTLAPIVDDPEQAWPAPGALDAVRALATVVNGVAVVTGRPAPVAASLLGLTTDDPANLLVIGHYGLQRWTSGGGVEVAAWFDTRPIEAVRDRLPALLREVGAPGGVAIEDKGQALAVHVRHANSPDDALALLREPLATLARAHGLRLEPGRMVLELRPDGVDKGVAIARLAADMDATTVCYAGDDLGDLAAYDALERMREDGAATLKICSDSDEVAQLRDRADVVFSGPVEVVGFLHELADTLG
jgi:trehalose 6-phosphate phosphatase